jgi:hypothetical protein
MLEVMDYSALKREASEKWFKKYKFCFFIKAKNPLVVEWVLKIEGDHKHYTCSA